MPSRHRHGYPDRQKDIMKPSDAHTDEWMHTRVYRHKHHAKVTLKTPDSHHIDTETHTPTNPDTKNHRHGKACKDF